MPQGPSDNPYQTWLKGISLGNGLSSGGLVANIQRISLIPGFSFNASGLLLNAENLGSGSWSHDVVWDPASASGTVLCQFAPTGNVSLLIKAILSGVPTQIAHIDIAAGAFMGTLVIPSVYTLPPNTIFELIAPSPADATLANVSGTVYLSLDAET
jgi:hypothetical protein